MHFAWLLGLENFLPTHGFSVLNHQKLVTFSRGADFATEYIIYIYICLYVLCIFLRTRRFHGWVWSPWIFFHQDPRSVVQHGSAESSRILERYTKKQPGVFCGTCKQAIRVKLSSAMKHGQHVLPNGRSQMGVPFDLALTHFQKDTLKHISLRDLFNPLRGDEKEAKWTPFTLLQRKAKRTIHFLGFHLF